MKTLYKEPPSLTNDGELAAEGWRMKCLSCGDEIIRLTEKKPDEDVNRPCMMCRRAKYYGSGLVYY
jgi:hypothetical protein